MSRRRDFILLVLLSAQAVRVGVSRVRDFSIFQFKTLPYNQRKQDNSLSLFCKGWKLNDWWSTASIWCTMDGREYYLNPIVNLLLEGLIHSKKVSSSKRGETSDATLSTRYSSSTIFQCSLKYIYVAIFHNLFRITVQLKS